MTGSKTCRIACLQINSIPFKVTQNVDRVRKLTESLRPGSFDMLVLPEMALTGYIFSGMSDIREVLEDPLDVEETSSPSLDLARELATRYNCYVVIGFPWGPKSPRIDKMDGKVSKPFDARPLDRQNDSNGPSVQDESMRYYNAALLVDKDGTLLHIFRKHFNFDDDKRWSQEGPGFEIIDLPDLGRICIAICMDLNSYNFETPFETYELARYCQREKVDMLIMSMAWLMSLDEKNKDSPDKLDEGPVADTINGWATRLMPFLESRSDLQEHVNFSFVNCNRTGTEQCAKFAGSSCALHFSSHIETKETSVSLLGAMSRSEGVQIFSIPLKSK